MRKNLPKGLTGVLKKEAPAAQIENQGIIKKRAVPAGREERTIADKLT
jgi:hypothetical protein